MRRRGGGRRGHAALELALALPLLLLLSLGALQLTLLQQARLLMEYAAFSAVRIGVVWNGSRDRMRGAALSATLPLYGRTDSSEALSKAQLQQRSLDEAFRRVGAELVRVETLSPQFSSELESVARRAGEAIWQELEFDSAGTFSEGETAPDPRRDAVLRAATVLRVRVQALYELKIPFANAALFWAWRRVRDAVGGSPIPVELADLADGTVLLEQGNARRRYFLPLGAEYPMRMQSNFYRKWAAQ